jgi:hypothetical protein
VRRIAAQEVGRKHRLKTRLQVGIRVSKSWTRLTINLFQSAQVLCLLSVIFYVSSAAAGTREVLNLSAHKALETLSGDATEKINAAKAEVKAVVEGAAPHQESLLARLVPHYKKSFKKLQTQLDQILDGVQLGDENFCKGGMAARAYPGSVSIKVCLKDSDIEQETSELTQVLLHEALHVSGQYDECMTDALRMTIVILGGMRPTLASGYFEFRDRLICFNRARNTGNDSLRQWELEFAEHMQVQKRSDYDLWILLSLIRRYPSNFNPAAVLVRLPQGGVNLQDYMGLTPLMQAASLVNAEVAVRKLLQISGVKPELRSKAEKTAADYARDSGHESLAKMIDETPSPGAVQATESRTPAQSNHTRNFSKQ